MKIGIYIELFRNEITGIGRYTWELLKRLPVVLPSAEIVYISKYPIKKLPINAENFYEENKIFRKIPSPVWFRYFSFRLINKLNLDYLWSPLPITPKFLNPHIKKVINVYDFNLYIVPETMDFKTLISYKLFFKKAINESDKIITISKGTANKLEKFFNRSSDAIIYPGVDRNLFKKTTKRLFEFDYILSVSTIEPRKNIKTLIEAFIELKSEGFLKDLKLVLVGKKGWKNKDILRKIDLYRDEIIYTGYVSDEELVSLYSNAKLFVFPSIYEGFGIPVLEARSCDCCVLTTDIEELREACGEGCIFTKPNKESLKKTLKDIFSGRLYCSDKKNIFLWDNEVKKLKNIFK